MRHDSVFYTDTPCRVCGRKHCRPGRGSICSGCASRIRRGADINAPWSDNNQQIIDDPPRTSDEDVELGQKIYNLFRRGHGRQQSPMTIIDLANKFDKSPARVKTAINHLRAKGIMIDVEDGMVELTRTLPETHDSERIDISKFKGKQIRIGLTADNHLCSKYYRADVLNALFDIWQQQDITEVYQCGNMIDGEGSFNRHDLAVPPGIESQIDYFIKNWPQREGITTRFVCGDDHEGWYTKNFGADVGAAMMHAAKLAGRKDLDYLGYMEHDVIFNAKNGCCKMRVIHAGGGTAYALSYNVQKIVESYQGGEKPNILLVGHFHKASYEYPREVHVVQAGCTQDQTPFMRKKRLQAMVGGWTVSFTIDDNGIVHDFMPQFHAFYDREFYRSWAYLWK